MEILNNLIPSAQAHMGGDFYGHHMFAGYGGMMGVGGGIVMLLSWILAIAGIVYLFRYLSGSEREERREKTPLDILKARYARGEIDKEEFERRKKDLG